ncbi:MAG TPA: tripartite tricarboxylate transporter TctB family protein [bacterium]|nr:tripartite tricarboxylate transporter TctB family protein [bacterium]
MPNKQVGIFLNSMNGFWTISAGILILLLIGRSIISKYAGKTYLSQALILETIFLISIVLLALTWWFPVRGEVSAAVVPRLWIAGIFICLIYLIAKILGKTEAPDIVAGDIALPIKFMVITLAYIVLMILIGYFIASIIFIAAAMTLLSYKRRLTIVAICAGWTAFSYLVFYRLLYVSLPEGILIKALFG